MSTDLMAKRDKSNDKTCIDFYNNLSPLVPDLGKDACCSYLKVLSVPDTSTLDAT